MTSTIVNASELTRIVDGPEGRLTILAGISLYVDAAEAVAICGQSGVGKSTLLGLLAGLDLPTAGEVALFGKDLAALDEDGRAALRAGRVGFVFQSFQLLPALTALENVMLPLELGGERAQARMRSIDSLERVGLGARLHHYTHQLSGGEQQRVAIARAFAPAPDVLFADEPTGNLDQHTGSRIIDLLFELRAEHHTALVLVTHDTALTSKCERTYQMEAGRILLTDTSKQRSVSR